MESVAIALQIPTVKGQGFVSRGCSAVQRLLPAVVMRGRIDYGRDKKRLL